MTGRVVYDDRWLAEEARKRQEERDRQQRMRDEERDRNNPKRPAPRPGRAKLTPEEQASKEIGGGLAGSAAVAVDADTRARQIDSATDSAVTGEPDRFNDTPEGRRRQRAIDNLHSGSGKRR